MNRGPAGTVLLLGGAVVGLVVSGQEWVTGQAQDPVLGSVPVSATGTQVAPFGSAMALLALAAVLVVLLNRGWSRRLALGVVALSGAGLLWVVADVVADPSAAARGASTESLPLGLGNVVTASVTWAPWVALGAAACWLLGAGLAWTPTRDRGRARDSSPANPSTVPQTPTPLPAAEIERRRSARAWEDLSGGQDPTDDSAGDQRSG